MTTLTTKPVARLSTARDAGRNIIIIVGPGELLGFRLKGTRKVIETTVHAAYCMAAKAEALRIKAEKLKRKKDLTRYRKA